MVNNDNSTRECNSEYFSVLPTEFFNGSTSNGGLHIEYVNENAAESTSLGQPLVQATGEADGETISDNENFARQATGEGTHVT